MKTFIIKITILLFLSTTGMVIYSCNKSKLDLLPHGPTERDFFSKEDDFNKAVLGVYAKMSDFFWYSAGNSAIPAFLLPGDDITTNNTSEEFEQFGSMQPSSGRIAYLYGAHFQLIARANTVIQKINEENGVYKTAGLKNAHRGEAYFLRGYAYYNLWNFFGTAPLDTVRVTSSEQFTPPSTTGTQLLDQAIADFTAAASLLPASWDDANRGRVTANAANGMLGKALVFRASATKNAGDYTAAITAFDKITGVRLTANFADNFTWEKENNEESLFEFQATQPSFDNVWLDNDFDNPIGSTSIFWGYYDNNFALFGQSPFFATTKLANAFTTGDPRIAATFDPADRTIKKYVSDNKLSQSGVASVNNYRILRYADVLLLKAEAVLQSGGATADAVGLINQVRDRASKMSGGAIPAARSTSEADKATIMNWVMTERFLELAAEGQRWFDLRRWQLQGIINLDDTFFSSNTNTMSFQVPKHLNFPIPNTETDVNPNVAQNPGY